MMHGVLDPVSSQDNLEFAREIDVSRNVRLKADTAWNNLACIRSCCRDRTSRLSLRRRKNSPAWILGKTLDCDASSVGHVHDHNVKTA